MERHFDDLNGFLVGLFNDILKIEENALRAAPLPWPETWA